MNASRARRAVLAAALLAALIGCASKEPRPVWSEIRERYFRGFLTRNPITATFLGADGYADEFADVNGRLPDVTPEGRAEAAGFYRGILADLERVDPGGLSPDDVIDRDVVRAQIGFMLHMNDDLRFHERSLETYMVAPFRGVDWQIPQMTDLGRGDFGTEREWDLARQRVTAVPAFLRAVEANLRDGIKTGNVPDFRMVQDDGIDAVKSNATYFRVTLPDLADRHLENQLYHDRVASELREAGEQAAAAFEAFAAFLESAYAPTKGTDHYAAGEAEYLWRMQHNLKIDPGETPAALFDYGQRKVLESQDLLIEAAKQAAARRRLRLDWSGREASLRAVRAVMDDLSRDYPKSDDEMFRVYRTKALELVEYARAHGMFALPEAYKLEIVETPPVLQSTLEAAYYPAPAFRPGGAGRFFLTPSHGDVGVLKENNRHAVADLCAHEGFPGHDWQYQFMRARASSISKVRWLTPGAVEDCSSMWSDSMSAEGWALYAEELMAEPQPGAPGGFYTPEERIYQLKWQVLRDARIRIDVGLHTGRMGFDEAVDYYLDNVELLPGACRDGGADPVRKAACNAARRAIYRYSKWPTQAITYHLGKRDILDLRRRCREVQGGQFDLRRFHETFLSVGTIPGGYFRERLLEECRAGTPTTKP